MPGLLVIADDLSGAMDVGVQFAKRGIRAMVTIRPAAESTHVAGLLASNRVVIVDIQSRHVSATEAARRVTRTADEARAAGLDCFYKKTDSTLRGNLGAELEALLNASGFRTLCFVPAHPLLGRTTRDGVQFVHGTPLHESPFAHDPRSPVRESDVISILARQSKAHITLVRQNELDAFVSNPPAGLVVFDAESESDVRCAAHAIQKAGCLMAMAGPAAFASCLPDLLPFAKDTASRPFVPRQLLVVNGSLNEVALRQCALARDHGFASTILTPLALLGDGQRGANARTALVQESASLITGGRDLVLASVWHRDECAGFNRAAGHLSSEARNWPDLIALNIGRIVAGILSECLAASESGRPNFTLAVFGGDTLAGIARANHWTGFAPCGEPVPGVALAEIPGAGIALLSKPGGFGNEDVLLTLRDTIRP